MMTIAQIVDRCDATLAGLVVPQPFNRRVFLQNLARHRDRDIVLKPLPTAAVGICGMWISKPDCDFIFYQPSPWRWREDHSVLHECGHMLLGHTLAADAAQALLPDLSLSLLLATFGPLRGEPPTRGHPGGTRAAEYEADVFAERVMHRGNCATVLRPRGSDGIPEQAGRLAEMFGVDLADTHA